MSYTERCADAFAQASYIKRTVMIEQLAVDADAEIARLRKREASLFEALKRCERDAQRALRWQADIRSGKEPARRYTFEDACRAIQQRAAGREGEE